jgi:tripartite-type tricarboxylate transporter receptor subunit TctC
MRRIFEVKGALATALSMAMLGSPVFAETFPSKPIKVVSPYSGGGNSELFVRLVAEEVGRTIGQRVFVEPRPGAGGNLATEAVVRSAPDGYTILMAAPLLAINAALYTKLKIDPLMDLTPITLGVSAPYVMYATATIPAKDAGELITLAKAQPGTINFGSLGIGSGPHLGGALFGMQAGIDIVHVPYRGFAQILPDLLRGTVHFSFNGVGVGGQLVENGQLRVLGHTGSREVHGKIEGLKGMNPVSDILPGYELLGYYGFWAPKDTPAPVIQKLNQEFARAMKAEAISAKILQMGMMPEALSPDASYAFLAKDIEKWRAVVVAAGVKVEE